MTVKRYTPTQCCEHDGTYVTYSDYQKLVTENTALRRIALSYHILTVPEREAPTEPEIDAAIAEIKAQGVDEFGSVFGKLCAELKSGNAAWMAAKGVAMRSVTFAANLRAGRKG